MAVVPDVVVRLYYVDAIEHGEEALSFKRDAAQEVVNEVEKDVCSSVVICCDGEVT